MPTPIGKTVINKATGAAYSRAVESGQIEQHPSIALTVRTVQHALNRTI